MLPVSAFGGGLVVMWTRNRISRISTHMEMGQGSRPEGSRIRSRTDRTSDGLNALLLRTENPELRRQLQRARAFAKEDDSLLLEGESGTGKTNLAAYLHTVSPRRRGPWQDVAVGGLEDGLAQSRLFGHRRGAFTGAVGNRVGLCPRAEGGTLFLDEIGKTTPTVQRLLLDLIEERRYVPIGADEPVPLDCRFISATNVPLVLLVKTAGFLPDLQQRLSGLRVRLPALRERPEDIPAIFRWLVECRVRARAVVTPVPRLHPELLRLVAADAWPGNLRELQAFVAQVVALHPAAAELTPAHYHAERPTAEGGRRLRRGMRAAPGRAQGPRRRHARGRWPWKRADWASTGRRCIGDCSAGGPLQRPDRPAVCRAANATNATNATTRQSHQLLSHLL